MRDGFFLITVTLKMWNIVYKVSGGPVTCIPDQADSCKEKYCTQYTECNDLFDIIIVAPSFQKVYSCQYQSKDSQYGKDNTQCSFFHTVFSLIIQMTCPGSTGDMYVPGKRSDSGAGFAISI